jgi:dihydrofolate reductase
MVSFVCSGKEHDEHHAGGPPTGGPISYTTSGDTIRAAAKVVYSRTLQTVSSKRTRIERGFDATAIRQLKESSRSDITIGGAELAGQAIAEGLVDERHLFLGPLLVGGGKRALPAGIHAELELLDERRFRNGVVHLHFRF